MGTLYRIRPISQSTSTPEAGAGRSQINPVTIATLGQGSGVAIGPDEIVYISDSTNHVIHKHRRGGTTSVFVGSSGSAGFADGQGTNARLNTPGDLFVDRSGYLWFIDAGNSLLRRVDHNANVSSVAELPSALNLSNPVSITIDDSGNIFVVGDD